MVTVKTCCCVDDDKDDGGDEGGGVSAVSVCCADCCHCYAVQSEGRKEYSQLHFCDQVCE